MSMVRAIGGTACLGVSLLLLARTRRFLSLPETMQPMEIVSISAINSITPRPLVNSDVALDISGASKGSITSDNEKSANSHNAVDHDIGSSSIDCARHNVNFARYRRNAEAQKMQVQKGATKLASWRSNILKAIEDSPLPPGDVYEFGVFNGGSFVSLHTWLARKVWGFDSFAGLPEESSKVDIQNSGFAQGKYKAKQNIPECLKAYMASGADLVRGFFQQSLTESLARERSMKPAAYVDIDVDIYTATYQALDWLFQSNLMQVGTLVGYDDWWSNPCSQGASKDLSPLATAEGKAHWEVAQKYKVKFICVAGSCNFRGEKAAHESDWGPIFKIESIGGDTSADHGFRMSNGEQSIWKEKNPVCSQEKKIHKLLKR